MSPSLLEMEDGSHLRLAIIFPIAVEVFTPETFFFLFQFLYFCTFSSDTLDLLSDPVSRSRQLETTDCYRPIRLE